MIPEIRKITVPSVMQVALVAAMAVGGGVALSDMDFVSVAQARSGENPAAVSRDGAPARGSLQPGLILLAACGAKKKGCGACNPCGAKKGCGACNPCAAKKKGCGACNPCGAKKACGACNPCAAKKKGCGACNPCGAKKACGACNPCNPCGGGAVKVSASCQIPRLVKAALCNPCAAKKKGCGACNPCGAKKACGACNPCAAKKKGCGACNPCGAKKACGACNPCAAKKKGCGACNPCAAKKACNPCGAKGACGACGPCGPCGAAEAVEVSSGEARSVYDCLIKEMVAGYSKSGTADAKHYSGWKNYANQPYVSDTHGMRYVNNYANAQAKNYGKYEKVGRMAVGAKLAKDSFQVMPDGKVAPGPLFLMEKMPAGFLKQSDNWRYTMYMPDGTMFGTTKGKGDGNVEFCIGCHMSVAEDTDSMMLLPDEYRVN